MYSYCKKGVGLFLYISLHISLFYLIIYLRCLVCIFNVHLQKRNIDMDTFKLPPFLNNGDLVTIISPSGKIDSNFLKGAKKRLESWGLKVIIAKHAASEHGRFAGSTRQRLEDLQNALDCNKSKAILCSRGGYGAVHLIDKLNFDKFNANPKWLLGYSDITLLHALMQKNGYRSIHSLMARHLAVEDKDDVNSLHLKNILFGQIPSYYSPKHKLNIKGKNVGVLKGGNLSVLYGLRGTPYDLQPKGTILFLEDIGERPYHIDRMMNNLKLGGVLENLSGLIVGQFTEYEEDLSIGKEVYDMIAELTAPYGYPVCFNFPVGHVTNNVPLICGAEVELDVTQNGATLTFK